MNAQDRAAAQALVDANAEIIAVQTSLHAIVEEMINVDDDVKPRNRQGLRTFCSGYSRRIRTILSLHSVQMSRFVREIYVKGRDIFWDIDIEDHDPTESTMRRLEKTEDEAATLTNHLSYITSFLYDTGDYFGEASEALLHFPIWPAFVRPYYLEDGGRVSFNIDSMDTIAHMLDKTSDVRYDVTAALNTMSGRLGTPSEDSAEIAFLLIQAFIGKFERPDKKAKYTRDLHPFYLRLLMSNNPRGNRIMTDAFNLLPPHLKERCEQVLKNAKGPFKRPMRGGIQTNLLTKYSVNTSGDHVIR